MSVRDLLPREHALWAWVITPLLTALSLHLSLANAAASGAVIAGFLGANAVSKGLRGTAIDWPVALVPFGVATLLGGAAVDLTGNPALLAGALLAVGGGGLAVVWRARGRFAPDQAVEAVVIAVLCALGAAIARADGTPMWAALTAEATIATWLAFGVVWVNRTLAAVLPGRVASGGAPWLAAAFALVAAVGALTSHRPLLLALLPLYLVRAWVHAKPARAAEVRRVGLTELAWAVCIALLAGRLA